MYHLTTFSLFCLSSFSIMLFNHGNMENMTYVLRDIARTTTSELNKKYPELELVKSETSIQENVIQKETIIFNVYRTLKQGEGIKLTKEIVELYLENLSSDNRTRVYLAEHPFSYKKLTIELIVSTPGGKNVVHPNIGDFTLEKGKFYFTTKNQSRKGFVSRTEIGYEDAISMIK